MYVDYNKNVTPRQNYIDYDAEEDDLYENNSSDKLAKVIKWTSIGFLCFGLANGGLTYFNYRKSLDWSTNRDSLKMADMPVDMLNDSGKQAEYKEDFLVLCNKAMDKNGQLLANKEMMLKLQLTLDKIKTAKPLYQKRYDKIAEKYRIRTKLNSLFAKKKQLKISSTPEHVQAVLKEIDPDLNSIYQTNNHDAFANQEVKIVHKLVDDINLITSVSTQLSNVSQLRHREIMFADNIVPSSYNRIYRQLNKLKYQWHYLDNFIDMQDKIQNILAEQLTKINSYNDYVNDQRDKQNAYQDLAKKRAAHKQANIDEIRKEREEKEEKERERLEAEKEKKRQEDEAKKAAEDDAKNDDDSDSSSDSSKSSSRNSDNTANQDDSSSSSTNTKYSSNSTTKSNDNNSNNKTKGESKKNGNSKYVNPSERDSDSEPEDILKDEGE